MQALQKAGRAFEGLEMLLGGAGFDLTVGGGRGQLWSAPDEGR